MSNVKIQMPIRLAGMPVGLLAGALDRGTVGFSRQSNLITVGCVLRTKKNSAISNHFRCHHTCPAPNQWPRAAHPLFDIWILIFDFFVSFGCEHCIWCNIGEMRLTC
jgi:hypothetical protein